MLRKSKAGISLAAHILLVIVLLSVGGPLLRNAKNAKEGIFRVTIGKGIYNRGLSIPTANIPPQATEVAGKADGVIKQATTAVAQATKVAGDIKDKAASAIAAGETLLDGLIPEACSVGTTSGCVEYGDGHSDCLQFPLEDSRPFKTITDISTEAGSLVNILQHVPSLRALFITGLACFIASSSYSAANALVLLSPLKRDNLPLKDLVCIVLGALACVAFICFAVFVLVIWSSGRGLERVTSGTFGSGFAFPVSIVSLLSSVALLILLVLEKIMGV